MTFTISDLLISEAEQAALTAALASAATPDPLGTIIAEKTTKVETIAGPYALPEAWLVGLVRSLVLYELYSRVGQAIPAHVKDAYAEAAKELTDIRDGQYRGLLRAGSQPASNANLPFTIERNHEFTRETQDGI